MGFHTQTKRNRDDLFLYQMNNRLWVKISKQISLRPFLITPCDVILLHV